MYDKSPPETNIGMGVAIGAAIGAALFAALELAAEGSRHCNRKVEVRSFLGE